MNSFNSFVSGYALPKTQSNHNDNKNKKNKYQPNDDSIQSMQQCQSRIQSRILANTRTQYQNNSQYEQQKGENVGQIQFDSITKWLQTYQSSNAYRYFSINSNKYSSGNTQNSHLISQYQVDKENYRFFKLTISKVMNLMIDLRSFQNYKSSKTNRQITAQLYLQFSLQFINLETKQSIPNAFYLSQYYKLDESKIKLRYQMTESLDLYFYLSKSFQNVALRINFYGILSEKSKKSFYVLDKHSVGTLLINLYNNWNQIFFFQLNFNQFFAFEEYSPTVNEQARNKKTDQYAQIKIIQSSSNNFSFLFKILFPFKVYTSQSKIMYIKNNKFPIQISPQQVKYSYRPYTMSLEVSQILIPNSQIYEIMKIYETLIKVKYRDITKISGFQIKQFRMIVCCHSGQKIISMANCLLKKKDKASPRLKQRGPVNNQRKLSKDQYKNTQLQSKKSLTNGKRNSQVQRQYLRDKKDAQLEQKYRNENNWQLGNDGLANLQLAFDAEGVMIICQIFCRMQVKLNLRDGTKEISQTAIFPISYLIKPIVSLKNDIKYVQNLFAGQLLSQNGIQKYLEHVNKQEQKLQKMFEIKKNNPGPNFSKIVQKAQSMSQSAINFYIFKEKIQGNERHYTTQMTQQQPQNNLQNFNLSQSFAQKGGNEINRLMMQKARIQRQRQKVQEKINRLNIEHNKTIPLLDTTQLKIKIYEQKLTKMKQQKYSVKQQFAKLKNQIDSFERQSKMKKDLIQDTLKQAFGGVTNVQNFTGQGIGRTFIGARGGRSDNKLKRQQQDKFYQDAPIRTIIPENDSELRFNINLENMIKIIKLTKEAKALEIVLEDIQFHNNLKGIKQIEIYGGLYKLIRTKAEIKKVVSQNENGAKSNQIKLIFQIPDILSANLLSSLMFSPLSLNIINFQTKTLIGNCYFYLSQLCNKMIEQINESFLQISMSKKKSYIWMKSQIMGKLSISFKLIKNNTQQALVQNFNQVVKNDLMLKIENKLLLLNQPQEHRKLRRIENFKKKQQNIENNQSNGIKLRSTQVQRTERQKKMNEKLSSLTGDKFSFRYFSMNLLVLIINLHNNSNEIKTYQMSINDPDRRYYQVNQQVINELGFAYDSKYLFGQGRLLEVNLETNKLFLNPFSKGALVATYKTKRRILGHSFNKISLQSMNELSNGSQEQFLSFYNHDHIITTTVAASGSVKEYQNEEQKNQSNQMNESVNPPSSGIQKVFKLQIKPSRDMNSLLMCYFVQQNQQFMIPFPKSSLIHQNNIYFEHEEIEIMRTQQQQSEQILYLTGYGPQLNKVILPQVLVFPYPQIFQNLSKELFNNQLSQSVIKDFQTKQIIRQLIQSQKIMNLSFEIWGCKKAKQIQLRLFQQLDILWEIINDDLILPTNQQTQKEDGHINFKYAYLSSQNLINLGFRSIKNPNKIQPHKKISINRNQRMTIVKSVVGSSKLGKINTMIEVQDQKRRQHILCRYLITLCTQLPYFTQFLSLQIELKKIYATHLSAKTYQNQIQVPQKIRATFNLDISSLLDNYIDRNDPQKLKLLVQNQIRFQSTAIFIKLISITEQNNQLMQSSHLAEQIFTRHDRIKKLLKLDNLKAQQSQQQNSIKSRRSKLQSQNDAKRLIQNNPFFVKLEVQIDGQLLLQSLDIKAAYQNKKQSAKLSEFEKWILASIENNLPITQQIIGLQLKQNILYFNLQFHQHTKYQEEIMFIKEILQKSALMKKRMDQEEKKTKYPSQKENLLKNLFQKF